ncbi:MAG: ABC transporter substrate-binding protein [Chloroflexota bacterium]
MTRRTILLRGLAGLGITGLGGLIAACQQPTRPPRPSDATPIPARPTIQPTATLTRAAPDGKPSAQVTPTPGPPKPGGAIVWATDRDPLDLDPHTAASTRGADAWAGLVYQSLVMFDENMRLMPALAEAWVMSDPTTWSFKLRQGVTFHDGTELEAEDVRYWFERLRATETASPYRDWYRRVVKVEPQGRYEVVFTLSAPYAPLLAVLASLRGSAIAPRKWLSSSRTDTKLTAVGSGPYKLAEYVPRSHVRYLRHREYWERSLPYLDEVTLQIVPDEQARLDGLRAGQFSATAVSPETALRLRADPTVPVRTSAGVWQQITWLNTRRPPFDDVRVRRAIALVADRPAVLKQAGLGAGQLTGPLPTGLAGWALPPESLPYTRDLEQARQLLAEAGHPDGFEATIKAATDASPGPAIAQQFAGQLGEIGINLKVEQVTAAELAAAITAKQFEACVSRVEHLPDPDQYCTLLYHTAGSQNATSWSSRAFDDLVDSARGIMDPGQRKALYDQAAGILLDEAPAIWWFTEQAHLALARDIRGYTPAISGRRAALKRTWLDR